jgi:hypothetical protein
VTVVPSGQEKLIARVSSNPFVDEFENASRPLAGQGILIVICLGSFKLNATLGPLVATSTISPGGMG